MTLTEHGPIRYRVAGRLCRPARPTATVQFLMSGFTYDHRYWDSGDRSHVQAAVEAGMATYTVARIGVGVGASARPPTK
ncbi:hypothetical protein [Dactylosporangium matsuzakiense]|uniref:Uncharacterized protein n=1 Tax=Dactylosporangium matsuzakiense TaxID=53360 RepID=A0A9W6KWK6_9ACTN|nr:hypothetical protein [Dactylosporangium matsuzakiense]UWZ44626.1 hypothetical protein Dmats_46050 [Dactylosporangium matsuzakiense]GLL08520.1 hypothetical protein GCM10017581_102870 [Dactylosporangium matsuzakiense]